MNESVLYGRSAVRFKTCRVEADWFEGRGQKDDWTRTMVRALSLTADLPY